VQTGNFLGIYLAKDRATVVCLDVQGSERKLVGCFGVLPEQSEQPTFQALAQRIAAVCAERQIKFTDAAVALDCAMFMQHSIHSEFSDVRKITQTVHFDTEEALGTDATDVAIAFKINSTDQTGADISAFTAQKQMMSDLLGALQSNNIDPFSVEPDVSCLARFVCQSASLSGDVRPLFAFLSRRNGYFISPVSSPWQGISPTPATSMRTFLLSPSQNRNEMLTKQVSMSTALLQTAGTANRLEIFDTADSVNCDDIARKIAVETSRIDITGLAKVSADAIADCPDAVEFAIAYGAAIAQLDGSHGTNFRSDFMPYQGRKLRLQQTLKFFAVAAVILMFAVGLYGLMQAVQFNQYRAKLGAKFAKDFSAVMFGEKMPSKTKEATRKISTALRRIKEAQKGFSLTGEEAVTAKLALVLAALNKCAATTGLNIETVTITDKMITINGNTPSPENTLKMFDALKKTGLNVLQQRISTDGGRSTFGVTVEPTTKQGGGGQ
jgi:type II secretory pathway component PulL